MGDNFHTYQHLVVVDLLSDGSWFYLVDLPAFALDSFKGTARFKTLYQAEQSIWKTFPSDVIVVFPHEIVAEVERRRTEMREALEVLNSAPVSVCSSCVAGFPDFCCDYGSALFRRVRYLYTIIPDVWPDALTPEQVCAFEELQQLSDRYCAHMGCPTQRDQ